MASRFTSETPSKFEGVVAGHLVTGEYEGKGCRVSVKAGEGALVAKLDVGSGRVALKITKLAERGSPAVLPMSVPHNGNGKVKVPRPEKRTYLLGEDGEISRFMTEYLTEEKLDRVTAGPSEPIIPVNSRKLPFGICVEYSTSSGKLVRTEWSKQNATRRAA